MNILDAVGFEFSGWNFELGWVEVMKVFKHKRVYLMTNKNTTESCSWLLQFLRLI